MKNSDPYSTADELADTLATMGRALKVMMEQTSIELMSCLDTSPFLTAKPTPDLDVHAALAVNPPNSSSCSPLISGSEAEKGKYLVIVPEVEAEDSRHLRHIQTWMQRFKRARHKPTILVTGSSKLFSPPIEDTAFQDFVLQLFRTSQQMQVPLVGCVQRPLTTDLLTLMKCLFPKEPMAAVSDAALLHTYLEYGQRTPIFCWELEDQEICFVYLKVDPETRPARIEFPKWMYDTRQHEELFRRILSTSFFNVSFPMRMERKG